MAKPIQFDWPDSAAASRATAAAADARGSTSQLIRTQPDYIQLPKAKFSLGNLQGRWKSGSAGNAKASGISSIRGATTSPSSISRAEQGERHCSALTSPVQTHLAQATSSIQGVSCRAEIVLAGPTEQGRPATVRRTFQQLCLHNHHLLQESFSEEDVPYNSSGCRPNKFFTSQQEQSEPAAEQAVAMQEPEGP